MSWITIYSYYTVLFATMFVVGLTIFVRNSKSKMVALFLLFSYICFALIITIIARKAGGAESQAAFNPVRKYHSIGRAIYRGVKQSGLRGVLRKLKHYEPSITEIALNVLFFVPIGFLLPVASVFFQRCWKTAAFGFSLSLCIETAQLISSLGWFDISDLFHNTLGVLLGYLVYHIWLRKQFRETAIVR